MDKVYDMVMNKLYGNEYKYIRILYISVIHKWVKKKERI